MAVVVTNDPWLPQLVHPPQFDEPVLACGEQIGMEILSAEHDVSMCLHEGMQVVRGRAHEFGRCAVGDQQELVARGRL